MDLFSMLENLTPAEWATFGIILVIIEIFVPSSFLLWPGLAALSVAALMLLLGDFGWHGQMVLFAGLTLISMLVGRRYYNPRRVNSDQPDLNQLQQRHLGQVYVLAEAPVNGFASVQVGDGRWRVRIEPQDAALAKGARVEVIEQQDTLLIVRATTPPPAG